MVPSFSAPMHGSTHDGRLGLNVLKTSFLLHELPSLVMVFVHFVDPMMLAQSTNIGWLMQRKGLPPSTLLTIHRRGANAPTVAIPTAASGPATSLFGTWICSLILIARLCHSMTGSEDENQHTLFLASTSQPCVRSWCPMTPPAIVDFQSSTLVRHYDGSISLP